MPQISDNGKNKELKIALHIYTTIGREKVFDEKYYFGDKKRGNKQKHLLIGQKQIQKKWQRTEKQYVFQYLTYTKI